MEAIAWEKPAGPPRAGWRWPREGCVGLGTSLGDKSWGCVVLPARSGAENGPALFSLTAFGSQMSGLMRGGDGKNHYQHLLRHQVGFHHLALPRDSLPPTLCAPPGCTPCVLGHRRAGTRSVPGSETNWGAGRGGGTEPAPSPPRWCSESDGAKETPLKFLLPLFCPLPHTVLPASTHARTHTTHAHSRTLGVLSLSLEEPGCSEESEEGE